jgi:predicted exporter
LIQLFNTGTNIEYLYADISHTETNSGTIQKLPIWSQQIEITNIASTSDNNDIQRGMFQLTGCSYMILFNRCINTKWQFLDRANTAFSKGYIEVQRWVPSCCNKQQQQQQQHLCRRQRHDNRQTTKVTTLSRQKRAWPLKHVASVCGAEWHSPLFLQLCKNFIYTL